MRKLFLLLAIVVPLCAAAVSHAGEPNLGLGIDRDAPPAGSERSPYKIDDSGEPGATPPSDGRQAGRESSGSVEDLGALDSAYRAGVGGKHGETNSEQRLRRGPWQTWSIGSDLYDLFIGPLLAPVGIAVIASGILILAGVAVYWKRRTRLRG
jgi:hypothetical protein